MDVTIADDGLLGPETRALVGRRTGIAGTVHNRHPPRGSFGFAMIESGLHPDTDYVDSGGTALTRQRALIGAVAESAERHSMRLWDGGELLGPVDFPTARERFEHVLDRAYLDMYDLDAVERSPFDRLTEDEPIHWTAALDVLSGRTWHLPAERVCEPPGGDGTWHYFRSTNGCACGTTAVQAVTNAIYEAIERDAFMRTWYTQTPLAEIDTTDLPAVESLRRRLTPGSHRLRFLSLPSPFDLATVVCTVTNPDRTPPAFAMGLSAAYDVASACRDAALEAGQLWLALQAFVAEDKHERSFDTREFWNLDDGFVYYTRPEHHDELGVLVGDHERIEPKYTDRSLPPKAELAHLFEELNEAGCRLFLKDMTTTDSRECGFTVVRAVVPELVPLSVPSLHPTRHPSLRDEETIDRPHPFS